MEIPDLPVRSVPRVIVDAAKNLIAAASRTLNRHVDLAVLWTTLSCQAPGEEIDPSGVEPKRHRILDPADGPHAEPGEIAHGCPPWWLRPARWSNVDAAFRVGRYRTPGSSVEAVQPVLGGRSIVVNAVAARQILSQARPWPRAQLCADV